MPYKDPEKKKEWSKQHYLKNKEKISKQIKQYQEKNKQEIAKQKKEYYLKNKEKRKEYYQTGKGKKSHRISKWKIRGVVHHNFDELYEKYINTEYCELCNVKLTVDKRTTPTTRCLDHCHESGEVRNIVCHSCNVRRR